MTYGRYKKGVLITVALLFVIVGGLWYIGSSARAQTLATQRKQQMANTAQQAQLQVFLERDSDNDGLKDWEEDLWGTNPNLKDTDGDGTFDGAEIALGRNPKVHGPKDLLAQEDKEREATERKKSEEQAKELTATDRLGREFFTSYLGLKASGNQDPAKINEVMNAAIQSAQKNIQPPTYTLSNLHIDTTSSPDALRVYGNTLASLLLANSSIFEINELAIIQDAVTTEKYSDLPILDKSVAGYTSITDGLKIMNVPIGIRDEHLALLNNFATLSFTVKLMRNLESDPFGAVFGAKQFQQSYATMLSAENAVGLKLKSSGIVFSANEPGASFFNK